MNCCLFPGDDRLGDPGAVEERADLFRMVQIFEFLQGLLSGTLAFPRRVRGRSE